MFDPRELLGSLMQGGLSQSTSTRLGHAMGPQGLGQSDSPLGGLLGQLGQAVGGGGGLADRAGGMFGDATRAVKSGNPLAVGGLAALAGALLGGGSGAAKGALGGGAMAVLGALAMSALKNWQQAQAGSPAGTSAGGLPLELREPLNQGEEQALQSQALLVLRAMANAVKADGRVDASEMQRIAAKIQGTGDDAAAQAFVMDELKKPMDLQAIVRDVRGPEVAVQVYAASLLAIEVDTPAEREYLQRLAQGLGLDAETVKRVHQMLGVTV